MSWSPRKLDELGYVARGRSRHRPRDAAHLYGGPYPFIQTGDVKHANFYITDYSQTYSEAGLAQSKLWPKGTLCITIAANIAETAILGIDACFPDSVIGFIGDETKCDTQFIKYKLETLKEHYQRFSQGAAQDNLSLEKLLSLEFLVPELDVQRKIASILSSYDDFIENNQRRIQLLEDSARLLYQEWFVRLRFPGHEHTRIVDGMPEGWEQKKLSDVLTLHYGKALKESDRVEGAIPVFGSSGIVGVHNRALVKGPGIIVGRKGNVGSVFWSETDYFAIDTVYYIDSATSSFFLYGNLQNQNFQNSDGAVPGLNRNHAYSLPIVIPPKGLRDAYEEAVKPVYDQMCILKNQSQKLKQARDLLLPRLMSGEIPV